MRLTLLLLACLLCITAQAAPRVIHVTRLDDDVRNPQPGMFRWALMQRGERRVEFQVAGDVMLKDRVQIRSGSLTVDGRTAPAQGICIRGGSLEFENAAGVTLRYLRIRLGDETTRAKLKREKRTRPKSSVGLDCLELRSCRDFLIEHCSFSWSCDELLSISRSHHIIVRDCILSEPLGDKRLHPYGDQHAYAFLASASTLTIERCLFAHFIMRGPQFEANDMRRTDRYTVRMTAQDNVIFDYKRSGSRYTTGPEDFKAEAKGKTFHFIFQDNLYVGAPTRYGAIERVDKHGTHPGVKVTIKDNLELPTIGSFQRKPWLAEVGCSHQRDAVDLRILDNLLHNRPCPIIDSQRDVGGWPDLSLPTPAAAPRLGLIQRLFR